MMQAPPIQVNHLFRPLDEKLIELLSSLTEDEWQLPTITKLWTVKDIVAHLLDTRIRSISNIRDKHFAAATVEIDSYQSLLSYLNQLNADWVNAMKRVSPQVLIQMMEASSKEFIEAITSLPAYEQAMFSVAWAGESASYNWFHVAREYTEQFVHQLQIRDAVNKHVLYTKEFFHPFIDTFMHGMPHTFRHVEAAEGTTIQITITTEAGGNWFIEKGANGWKLIKDTTGSIAAQVIIDPGTAWKLFSKGIAPGQARSLITFNGNIPLAEHALNLVAVMA